MTFVFNPNSDLVAKPLHVSPFMVCYYVSVVNCCAQFVFDNSWC